MKGWLIYDKIGAERNEWFIQKLTAELSRFGHALTLRLVGDFSMEELPDFALVRTINPAINRASEERGVLVFNNADTAFVACDKWETYCFAKDRG